MAVRFGSAAVRMIFIRFTHVPFSFHNPGKTCPYNADRQHGALFSRTLDRRNYHPDQIPVLCHHHVHLRNLAQPGCQTLYPGQLQILCYYSGFCQFGFYKTAFSSNSPSFSRNLIIKIPWVVMMFTPYPVSRPPRLCLPDRGLVSGLVYRVPILQV